VLAIQSNAGDFNAAQAAVDQVVEAWGKLDILVNNAGITKDQLLMRMSEADFDAVINTNMKSVFNMTKAVLRTMLKQKQRQHHQHEQCGGREGNAGQANYAPARRASSASPRAWRWNLGSRNIRSNAVAPGFIETEMTGALDEKTVEGWREGIPLKRGGTPTDVANACVFLGSDLSTYITGQTLHVCGGMLT
jgi:3-oxoacyl-[acyl-carrier protein] reductase